MAFGSHWGFESAFCNPGLGHEKGGEEGEGGQFRGNHLGSVPTARDLTHLNDLLLARCRANEARVTPAWSSRWERR
ncbi:transposase [Candidatus Methylomirabilis lanthanidiphila]|uniref:Transposase n=1 Tax=Candidatus Methylomirabilis lanthanidiphila TaxID=2211376 RepID=A0A564ZJL4_9BACT|nr:hypothetical protein [Candidatus Methylomirabilis lanthanidiphila]VUZ85540.1 transposase [Candidatus Methylomirabilis lanthanidiphila]